MKVLILSLLGLRAVSAIINGAWTTPADMRSSASLFVHFPDVSDENRIFCGGLLITRNTILTAAHCVYRNEMFASQVRVTVNDYNVYASDLNEETHSSRAIDILPTYVNGELAKEDLALVYLPQPLEVCKFNAGPEVARLPPTEYTLGKQPNVALAYFNKPLLDEEIANSLCFTSGWGITEDGKYSHVPKSTAMKLRFHNLANGKTLVGEPLDVKTKICLGDSGSPVFCLIRGVRYAVGLMTEIGTWKTSSNIEEHFTNPVARCTSYDFVKIVDIRNKLPAIAEILSGRKLREELAFGQKTCLYT